MKFFLTNIDHLLHLLLYFLGFLVSTKSEIEKVREQDGHKIDFFVVVHIICFVGLQLGHQKSPGSLKILKSFSFLV
jgi:hypothetical protein